MAIIFEWTLVVVLITILLIGLNKFKVKEEEYTTPKPIGLYKTTIFINDLEYDIKTEVTLDKDYGDDEISVTHTKIFGLSKHHIAIAAEILSNEHTLISKEEVKWKT